jgi:hypothetical protein
MVNHTRRRRNGRFNRIERDPTPEEIQAHLQQIQSTWSPHERSKRLIRKRSLMPNQRYNYFVCTAFDKWERRGIVYASSPEAAVEKVKSTQPKYRNQEVKAELHVPKTKQGLEPKRIPSADEFLDHDKYFQDARLVARAVIASRTDPDPLWIQFISPPASGKQYLIASLERDEEQAPHIYIHRTLFPSQLISGARNAESIFPAIQEKCLVIRDWDSTLRQLTPHQRWSLESILRDAYDHNVNAQYRNKVVRSYQPRFAFIRTGIEYGGLEGRFLTYRMDSDERIKARDHYELRVEIYDPLFSSLIKLCGHLFRISEDSDRAWSLTRKVAHDTLQSLEQKQQPHEKVTPTRITQG